MRIDTDSVEALWSDFRAQRPDLADEGTSYSAWHFCDDPQDADELVELVLRGVKRATAGSLWVYEAEGEPIPRVGDLSVITDASGRARCVIMATRVDVMPFDEVTGEFAAVEGEGDGSLAYWREGHRRFFERELGALGKEFTPEMPVVCERFEVVFAAEAGAGAETGTGAGTV